MSFAVVGHVEWVDFALVERVPVAGEIVEAVEPPFACPGGGGAVAAVQLARLAGTASFLTSVGEDDLGARVVAQLRALGVDVRAAVHPLPQRRAFTHLDRAHERTITVIGRRHVPLGADPLPWPSLAACDGVFYASGDVAALRAARAARVLVATPRWLDALGEAGVPVDVLVGSATDDGDRIHGAAIDPPPTCVVLTDGERGGRWHGADGSSGRWDAVEPPGPLVDAYGCGDAFGAGLTYGLGAGLGLAGALHLAARCGAWCLTGRGPYGNLLRL